MSQFGSYVVPLNRVPHPNADSLQIVHVKEPFEASVIIRTQDWEGEDKAVWILPDSITGSSESDFGWYGLNKKTKAIKLRGLISYGFFVKAKPHHQIGDEVSAEYGVTKYEEPIKSMTGGDPERDVPGTVKYTDIENSNNSKFQDAFEAGDQVVILEKLDGSNCRYVVIDGELHCGSHHRWVKSTVTRPEGVVENSTNWWKMAKKYALAEKLAKYPNLMFVGEAFGNRVNLLKYFDKGLIELAFYDIFNVAEGRYLDWDAAVAIFNELELPVSPVLYRGPFVDFDTHKKLADQPTQVPNATGIMEGWVVKTVMERFSDKLGRSILKYKTPEYLSL